MTCDLPPHASGGGSGEAATLPWCKQLLRAPRFTGANNARNLRDGGGGRGRESHNGYTTALLYRQTVGPDAAHTTQCAARTAHKAHRAHKAHKAHTKHGTQLGAVRARGRELAQTKFLHARRYICSALAGLQSSIAPASMVTCTRAKLPPLTPRYGRSVLHQSRIMSQYVARACTDP